MGTIVGYSVSDFGMVEYGNNNNNADSASPHPCVAIDDKRCGSCFLLDYICISSVFDGDKYFFYEVWFYDSIAVELTLLLSYIWKFEFKTTRCPSVMTQIEFESHHQSDKLEDLSIDLNLQSINSSEMSLSSRFLDKPTLHLFRRQRQQNTDRVIVHRNHNLTVTNGLFLPKSTSMCHKFSYKWFH